MSRLLKILAAVIAVVVVLTLGVAVAVMLLFDPNEYRDEIGAIVEERTGRTFSIDGEIGLRVLPCCAVAVDDARLGNPPGFESPDFASVRTVRLGLQLMPLLFDRRVVIDEVTLAGLDVKLLRRADGKTNWEFAAEQDEVAVEADSAAEDGEELPELSVAGVNVNDAALELRDDTAGTHFVVEDLDIVSGPVAAGEAVDIDVSMQAKDVPSSTDIDASFSAALLLAEDMSRAGLSGLASSARIESPELPGGTATVDLEGASIDVDLQSGRVDLDGFEATLAAAGISAVATLSGTAQGDDATLTGSLTVPEFSPRDAMAELGGEPIVTADPAVLGALQLDSNWKVAGQRLEITSLNARLDDSRLTGRAATALSGPGGTTFDMQIDAIDLDRYAAPTQDESGSGGGAASEEAEIPVEALRGVNATGTFTVGQLGIAGLALENVTAKLTASNGVLRIDPSTADVYGGRYEGNLQLDVRGDVPQLTFAQKLDSVQTGSVLLDLYDAENLQGLLQANLAGTGSGKTTTDILRNLRGSVALDLDDAVYKGADVWYEIRKSVARIKGKPGPATPADPQTEITALGFAGNLADGILRSNRLIAEIPFIRVEGGGAFDLLQNQLDYRLNARMLSRPNFPDADDLADLERVTIPIIVTGDAAEPTIGIDLEELAKDAAVQKAKDRLLKKLGLEEPEQAGDAESNATDQQPADEKDKARELLKKGLRDLFD